MEFYDNETAVNVLLGVLIGVFATVTILVAFKKTPSHFKVEAVKAGHGEWVVNEDGNAKFQWLEPCKD